MSEWDIRSDGHLYRTMIEVVRSCTDRIKGVLWYQGCSDASPEASVTYLTRFMGFVAQLRSDLNDAGLPFLTCQLNRYISRETNEEWNRAWGRIRDAQRLAAKIIPGVYVVPTLDATLSDVIHISSISNIQIGERLAATALKYLYGRDVLCDAPDIQRVMKLSGNRICLEFCNITGRLFDYDTPPDQILFRAEDEDGAVDIIDYKSEGDRLILMTGREPGMKLRVHHVMGSSFNGLPFKDSGTHLPILSFYDVMDGPDK